MCQILIGLFAEGDRKANTSLACQSLVIYQNQNKKPHLYILTASNLYLSSRSR